MIYDILDHEALMLWHISEAMMSDVSVAPLPLTNRYESEMKINEMHIRDVKISVLA